MVPAAVVAYVVAAALLGRAQAGTVTLAKVLLPTLPGFILGALVPDWRVLLVPAVGLGGVLVVSVLSDPGCDSCGFTGSWGLVTAVSLAFFVAAAVPLAIGIVARRAVNRRRQGRADAHT
jgi:hypothetical protein